MASIGSSEKAWLPVLLLIGLLSAGAAQAAALHSAPSESIACDGRPNWCIEVVNHANAYAEIDVDGRLTEVVAPKLMALIPASASRSVHNVTACTLRYERASGIFFGFHVEKQCVANARTTFERNVRLEVPAL